MPWNGPALPVWNLKVSVCYHAFPKEGSVKRLARSLVFFSGLGLLLVAAVEPEYPSAEALQSIRAADLRSDLYFLAADEMQGRSVNSLFNRITSSYLANRFELMGLEPVDGEGYFQYFSLLQARLSTPNRLEIHHSQTPLSTIAIVKEDFFPSTVSANGRVSAPAVFAGYGITAEEYKYDDYRDLDSQGTIVVVMNHEPGEKDPDSAFDGAINSEYSRQLYKILNAQRHGAVGVIFIADQANHSSRRTFSAGSRLAWPEDGSKGPYNLKLWVEQVKIPAVYASREMAENLLQESKTTVREIQAEIDRDYRPRSFLLRGVSATIETALLHDETRTRNVMAQLPGSDPQLRDEWVIVSAHFDHVGVENGQVFNGADDDASGTVGLLEVAEAHALNPSKPARSILFVGWNAEEKGLLGSRYYVERPVFSLPRTVAVLQMDMIGRNEEIPDPGNPRFRGLEKQTADENINSLNILGYSRSDDLRRMVEENNQRIGLDLKFRYDDSPSNLLRRSDNWPFLVKGVPAVFFHTGLHPDYHRPTDTPDKINYAKMEKIARLVFLCSWDAANNPGRPRLNSE